MRIEWLARLIGAWLLVGVAGMWVSSGVADASRASLLARQQGLQGRVMWLDAEANLWELSKRAGVADTIGKCKAANINTIVVDVKPLSGYVLYNSKLSPKLTRYRGRSYPQHYDLLQTVIDEAHRAGMQVHASINVFSEGSRISPGGPAYTHPDWQCVVYDMERFLTMRDGSPVPIRCTGEAQPEELCLYGPGAEDSGELPPNTFYVRVGADGRPLQRGRASGRARLSAPEGGYLLVASGEQGDALERIVESGAGFKVEGKSLLRRMDKVETVHNAVFVNPLNPEVRSHALGVVREICQNYRVDGIVLDRMRYPNLFADFSDTTREAFEKYAGTRAERWPEDVFTRRPAPADAIDRGPLFGKWVCFRAQVMRDFLAEAREVVKSARPEALLGIYVGSWYPLYYDVGVNWGSPGHKAAYDWWPEGYEKTGYADLVDYMCTGCYYTYPTRREAAANGEEEWKSVEAAAEESMAAVEDATFVYGSLYVLQYKGKPGSFAQAIRQCLDKTQGCMIFDLVYVRDYDWWSILRQSFPSPARAPHDAPDLLSRLKGEKRSNAE